MRLKRILLSPWINLMIRFTLGSVFLYAGVVKLIDPKAFARVISQYGLVPESLLAPIAIGLPVLEVLAGIGLIFAIRGSLSVISGLLVMFVFVLWYGILRNLNIDCGCFSPQELKNYAGLQQALYRDIGMLGGVIYLYVSNFISGVKTTFSLRTKDKTKLKEDLSNA